MKKIKYFFETAIVKIIFGFFKLFSIDKASGIGAFIARNIGPKLPITNIARNNIRLAMPETSAAEIEHIITDMWDNLGRVAAEFTHIFNLSEEEFFKRVTIEGSENISLSKNGLIFFSGHLANWEIAPRVPVIRGIKTNLIYRAANNKSVDNIMVDEREKQGINLIPKGFKAAKKIIEILKAGEALAMLVDQKMNDGISVPFFGKAAMTAPAIARLAIKFDCPVIPSQVIRTNKANFILKFYPPLKYEKTEDQEQDVYNIMVIINQLLEGWIKEHPSQWFWLHNRWK
jgi:KDO2-lipid IV(A) lauroyltransferase